MVSVRVFSELVNGSCHGYFFNTVRDLTYNSYKILDRQYLFYFFLLEIFILTVVRFLPVNIFFVLFMFYLHSVIFTAFSEAVFFLCVSCYVSFSDPIFHLKKIDIGRLRESGIRNFISLFYRDDVPALEVGNRVQKITHVEIFEYQIAYLYSVF